MSENKNLIPLIYSIIFIILINAIGNFLHFRLDLTAEKQHTLSTSTENILTNLDDIIYIKVYLEGSFPSGFKRLQNQTKETLENFKNIAGKRLDFEFINPSSSSSEQERKAVYTQLTEKGLQSKFMGGNHFHPEELRIYTLKEAQRIMTLPDDYKHTGSLDDSQARIGLMVAPMCMYHLAECINENVLEPYAGN